MATYVYDDFRVTLTPRADGGYDARAPSGPTASPTTACSGCRSPTTSSSGPSSTSPVRAARRALAGHGDP